MCGTIYLLHFSGKVADHAGHYLGFSDSPDERLEDHLQGRGSPLVRAAVLNGLVVERVCTWPGDRTLERKMKKAKNLALLCPLCREKVLAKRAARMRLYRARRKSA